MTDYVGMDLVCVRGVCVLVPCHSPPPGRTLAKVYTVMIIISEQHGTHDGGSLELSRTCRCRITSREEWESAGDDGVSFGARFRNSF